MKGKTRKRKAVQRPRSARRGTMLDPNHPKNRMKVTGERAKKDLRAMSNAELTTWVEENVEDEELQAHLLSLPRSGRIKWIVGATERHFAEEWNASEKVRLEAEAAAEVKREEEEKRKAREEIELQARIREAEARKRAEKVAACCAIGFVVVVLIALFVAHLIK